jgi:hypothetical protein
MRDEINEIVERCCAQLEPYGYSVVTPDALRALQREGDDERTKLFEFMRTVMKVLDATCSCGLAGLCESCLAVDMLGKEEYMFRTIDSL